MIRSFLLRRQNQLHPIRNVFVIQEKFWSSSTFIPHEENEHENYDIDLIEIPNIRVSKEKKESLISRKLLTQKLKHALHLNQDEVKVMLSQTKNLTRVPITKISNSLEFLFEKEITATTILQNPWLLTAPAKYLESKMTLVQKLEPKNINDFVPLMRVAPNSLMRIYKIYQRERNHIPERNRIYYFSKCLNVDPALVTKYFSTHMFMFEVSFDMLIENLNIMMEYKMAPISILKDLWAFKYLPKSIRLRLERCRVSSKCNLKPWLIRCPERVLRTTLKYAEDHRELLGESNTLIDYISERLGYDIETTNYIVSKHEAVKKCRIMKVKEILDYLLEEEKFEKFEVANVIRILCHSLETTKKRINELKEHGCRPTTLTIVCRSQNEYNKFLNKWIESSISISKK